MTGAYIDKDYVYAVARIRSAELKLFDKTVMDQLIQARSADECIDLLLEKDWGKGSRNADEILSTEREKIWELIDELIPDRQIFSIFRMPDDYSNLKAAIKESVMDYDYPGIYISEANIDPMLIRQAVKERNYQELPDEIADLAATAHSLFLKTRDGQLCDIVIDKACIEAMLKAGAESGNEFIKMYAELVAVSSNIKTAVRAANTGKDRNFLEKAICDCPTLPAEGLIKGALNGTDGICSYLMSTDYSEAVGELKKSPAAFERWCDNLIIGKIRSELYNSFGIGPLAAYILARENEIKSVRIILSGKQNGFSEDVIRERVRETYV